MTGASEAIMALTCLFAEPGGSIVMPEPVYPAVPVLARAWGLAVREYELDREQGFAQTADGVLAAVDASTRAGVREHASQPHGLGDGGRPSSASWPRRWQRAAFR